MLTICKNGPTRQTIGRINYCFELDGACRAVCEVGYDHLHVFLARPEVYALSDPVHELHQSPQAPRTTDLGANPGMQELIQGGNVRVLRQRPQRGRPRKDDGLALTQMHALIDKGMGLNTAAAVVAALLATGSSQNQHSVRKRLLRKHREETRSSGSEPTGGAGPEAAPASSQGAWP
jgi:hypothetical protein